MVRVWRTAAGVAAGLLVAATCAMPQTYTISARPGVVNYVEGSVSLGSKRLYAKAAGKTFLNANDLLSTDNGKAEVLLTPGVFLRMGADSEIRMVSPSLVNTSIELTKGEIFVEANDLAKESDIQIVDHNATVKIVKPGLYRVSAANQPSAAVVEGKAEVTVANRTVNLGKNRQVVLDAQLRPEKFAAKKEDATDDLYAWSQTRDQFEAALSYSSARTAAASSYYGSSGYDSGFGGYGYAPFLYGFGFGGYGPGWAFNPFYSSWAWLPGDGAFFSPFGYGFFAPGAIGYAPVTYVTVAGRPVAVPVNPVHPPLVAAAVRPAIYNANGMAYHGNLSFVGSGAAHVSGRSVASASTGGGFSSGSSAMASSGGFARSSGASMGGSHSGGGGHR